MVVIYPINWTISEIEKWEKCGRCHQWWWSLRART